MSKKKVFSTSIDIDCIKALKHLAVDTDKSLGRLLEEAIRDLVEKYKQKLKDEWRNQPPRRFNDLKLIYLHVLIPQKQGIWAQITRFWIVLWMVSEIYHQKDWRVGVMEYWDKTSREIGT